MRRIDDQPSTWRSAFPTQVLLLLLAVFVLPSNRGPRMDRTEMTRRLAKKVCEDLARIEQAIERYRDKTGMLPRDLRDVELEFPESEIPLDPVENEYSYRRDSHNGYQVRWLGADGDEGGEGLDADWTREELLRAGLLDYSQEP